MPMIPIAPTEARRLIQNGARLIDIRDRDEHVRKRIPGAENIPLALIERLEGDGGVVVFHCRSGARTQANAARLAQAAGAPCYAIEGGLDAWRNAGLDIAADRRQPLELIRQVQIVAGGLVLLGILLGAFIGPAFLVLPGFVGAGLIMAGASGWCGLAHMLLRLPWNRRMAV